MSILYHSAQQLPMFVTSKSCSQCGIDKPLDAFPPQKERTDGHRNECKDCKAAYMRARRSHLEPKHLEQSTFFRVCSQCHTERFFDQFPTTGGRSLYGIRGVCRNCKNVNEREYYASNPQRHAAYKREARKRDPERFRSQSRRFYMKHRETILKQNHVRYWANHQQRLAQNREWREKNIERARQMVRIWNHANPLRRLETKMRYLTRKKQGTVGKVSYARILERDGLICHICNGVIHPGNLHFDHVIPLSRGGPHSEDNIKVSHSVCNIRKGNRFMEELTPFHRRGPYPSTSVS